MTYHLGLGILLAFVQLMVRFLGRQPTLFRFPEHVLTYNTFFCAWRANHYNQAAFHPYSRGEHSKSFYFYCFMSLARTMLFNLERGHPERDSTIKAIDNNLYSVMRRLCDKIVTIQGHGWIVAWLFIFDTLGITVKVFWK